MPSPSTAIGRSPIGATARAMRITWIVRGRSYDLAYLSANMAGGEGYD